MEATVAVFGIERGGPLASLLTDLRVEHRLLPAADLARTELDAYAAVVVIAEAYPSPLRLQDDAATRLAAFVAAGGSAYVEYATDEIGLLPAVDGEPVVAGYERIVVAAASPATGTLAVGDLLEEHQSRYLRVTAPDDATVPLVYAKVAGVYEAVYGLPAQTAPALLQVRHGKGTLTYATTALSHFERGRYTLAGRWNALWHSVLTSLLPAAEQAVIAQRFVPLRAWTSPRRWIDPAEPVRLVVETRSGVELSAARDGSPVELAEVAPGRYESIEVTLSPGEHTFEVHVGSGEWRKRADVSLRVRPRAEAYRAMLERGFAWFERAGMLFRRGRRLGRRGRGARVRAPAGGEAPRPRRPAWRRLRRVCARVPALRQAHGRGAVRHRRAQPDDARARPHADH